MRNSKDDDATRQFQELINSGLLEWHKAIRSAEKGDDIQLLNMMREGMTPEAGRLVSEYYSLRRTVLRKRGTPNSIIEPRSRSNQQVLLHLAKEEYQAQRSRLEKELAAARLERKKQELGKKLAALEHAIASEFGLNETTFANHLGGSHGPTNRAKRSSRT